MKAAVTRAYGPPSVIELVDVPEPELLADDLLVRVTASPVTAGDSRMRALNVPRGFGLILRLILGWRRPRRAVMGMEFAGVVEAAGPGFAVGQRVFGITGLKGGCHAEKLAIAASGRVRAIPEGLSDAEAAGFFFGGLTALDFLTRQAGLEAGQRLLINGATGAVGSAAVQIGRHLGAEVTALCGPANVALALELGAHHAQGYDAPLPAGPFDVTMDCAGTLPYARAMPHLAAGGQLLVVVVASLAQQLGHSLRPRRNGHRLHVQTAVDSGPAMDRLIKLYRAGGYRPLVGAEFAFAEIRAAHALADTRHKRGAVVVKM
ncbi:NAD(P)-dependent alcohol dehydrogenase [Neogemmobacter tilapiae]|uniref:Alcohol dehydrogenase n=1 Tax=Neogemmobacter tilapiae TaxID=875041 RepID=A0A918TSZ9_9RHOB|nr:NAD(P)-dependent alcohol dehydrogenase [Gemmobacter tilapiae]GHC58728.1 alcohol dehydrogenase [Gemmobacter tilapiae]